MICLKLKETKTVYSYLFKIFNCTWY